ncbi:hypothetical protein SGQ44_10025 [Flavobacterium sp. Fl-77]|uniref:Phosphoribosylpyrophosphate synthetase n=1 Tax=Flavobacterium flavipigmentatum TaxID=2893884 RepID=A0AAJ2S916_9FLAO|nr:MULTISPECIES: hypothetical protein [unclassified Flavobacterium]MDX6182725.1 hypothetical protein [Flavobacterium sp. Fl-33]MDX6186096.1 hypothetical protein [Flavobacterium sp. Fl-77]UFH38245.1 hypothetical protein LNP22_16115 [Flavobacterium sp. F-70]
MTKMYHYATVSKALDQLNEKGFTFDFNLNSDMIKKNPEKFEIVHVYRYEGDSDPGDEAVVYGIKSISGKKGVYVAGFSADSDQETAKFLFDLNIKGR